jgi:hypothetical protein
MGTDVPVQDWGSVILQEVFNTHELDVRVTKGSSLQMAKPVTTCVEQGYGQFYHLQRTLRIRFISAQKQN